MVKASPAASRRCTSWKPTVLTVITVMKSASRKL